MDLVPKVFSFVLTEVNTGVICNPALIETGHLGIPHDRNKPGDIISASFIAGTESDLVENLNATGAPKSIIDKNNENDECLQIPHEAAIPTGAVRPVDHPPAIFFPP